MSDCCDICGIGFYLPSGVCDHCDSQSPNHSRPIETAPKDGTRVMLFYSGIWVIGTYWVEQQKWMDDDFNYCLDTDVHTLTHWLPIPPAPSLV